MKAAPPRRRFAIALALSTFAACPPLACAEDADPWFGPDKLLHFEATSALAVVGYAGASLKTENRPTRVAVGATLALGVGIGKELWDLSGHGDPSWRDLTWDVIGTATGVLVASAIDWIARRAFPRATLEPTGAAR